MKKKSNVKTISVSQILILIIIVVVVCCFVNKGNKQITNIGAKEKNLYIIQEELDKNIIEEKVLDESKCQYDTNDNGKVSITEYIGEDNIVVIPEEIKGIKVQNVEKDAFVNNNTIEAIKVPKSISDEFGEIEDFEVSKSLSDSDYTVYATTKDYNEDYLRYTNLNDKEKAETEYVPEKFLTSLGSLYSQQVQGIYAVSEDDESSKSEYDLREKITINVENQNPFGICGLYSDLTMVRTYMAKNLNKVLDFSEMHLAVVSRQGQRRNVRTFKN